MKFKLLGKSGLRVSELCLGTMTFGKDWGWGSSDEESKKVFDTYVEKGGNFFDTANMYTNGSSERLLGQFVKSNRDDYVIATKYTLSNNPEDPNASGNHRKNLRTSIEGSLKRLNTDYIDLLWIHAWDKHTPIEETMRALDDIVRSGKVLYIGASDVPAWVISRANTLAEWYGWTPFVAVQLEYNLLERTIEREYFEMTRALDLAITPWGPLAMGLLTGKYCGGQKPPGRILQDPSWAKRYGTDHAMEVAEKLLALSKKIGKSSSQVALRWMMQQNANIIPILGARSVDQLKDNLGAADFVLTAEQMKELDRLNPLDKGFPHEFLEMDQVKELIMGKKHHLIASHRN